MIARAMKTGRLGEYVEPRELGARSGTVDGWIPLAEFSRLSALLERDAGEVQITLQFTHDDEQRPIVRGSAAVPVWAMCQRCLESVELELVARIDMVLVKSDAEAREILPKYDTVVFAGERAELVTLIEDDLILSLPHDACPDGGPDCPRTLVSQRPDQDTAPARSPFDILAKLKGNLSE